MTPEELAQIKVDKSVDARGTSCPGPLLAAKKAIGQIEKGQVMEVLLIHHHRPDTDTLSFE